MAKRFIRARKPEQKEMRRRHLLEICRGLIEKDLDVNNLSLNKIARRAGMAKANVYRYFETREAVLIDLLWDEWQDWYRSFKKNLNKNPKGKKSLETLVKSMAATISERELLCALSTALPSILEKNLSEETIRIFKFKSMEFFGEIAGACERTCPELSKLNYAIFLQDTVTLIAGLYPFAHPPRAVAKVVSSPELKFFRREFKQELERYMLALAFDARSRSPRS
ncbi:MAG: hypothetical protein RJB66_1892 [Pseudomonadota bacterium]|jgi:AcrR family transcriptional regulator